MFSHLFSIAYRSILKNKVSSIINITSLGIGIAVALLIVFFVKDELAYNRFHNNFENVYRATGTVNFGGKSRTFGSVSGPMGPAFLNQIPEITAMTRIVNQALAVKVDETLLAEQALYIEPDFFQIFSFHNNLGDPLNLFKEPNQVVMSREMAEKYLADQDPIGSVIEYTINGKQELLTVCGIMEDVPDNSSIQFKILLPFFKYAEANAARIRSWRDFSITTFFLTTPGTDPKELISSANSVLNQHMDQDLEIGFQALADFHLNSEIIGNNGMKKSSDPWYSYILLLIALFVLLMASVNYTNLSLANALPRATEIGVRKSYGASKKQLIAQFLGESMLLGFCSLVVAVLLLLLFLTPFRDITSKTLAIWHVDNLPIAFIALGILLLTSLLAGAYPAFVMANVDPIKSLRRNVQVGGKNLLGRILVILQFSIATFFVIITFVVNSQTRFIDEMDLGYDNYGIVGLPIYLSPDEHLLEKFIFELQGKPRVKMLTADMGGLSKTSFSYNNERFRTFQNRVDFDFLRTFGMELLKGRDFSRDFAIDMTDALIVNETFLETAGITTDPIGIRIVARAGFSGGTIIGVMKDHHFQSLKSKIEPMVFHLQKDTGPFGMIWVKLAVENNEHISIIRTAWEKILPTIPFAYFYQRDESLRAYGEEFRLRKIVNYASLFALIIASLGLFGLSSLMTKQRIKELGVRKILGASVPNIITRLSGSYLVLILIAIMISSPLAYYFGQRWLENFIYHAEIDIGIFLLTSFYLLALALITVSFQSMKAAKTNPVNLIREN